MLSWGREIGNFFEISKLESDIMAFQNFFVVTDRLNLDFALLTWETNLFLSCLKGSQSTSEPDFLALAQDLFLSCRRSDNSVVNHWLSRPFTVNLRMGACLSTISLKPWLNKTMHFQHHQTGQFYPSLRKTDHEKKPCSLSMYCCCFNYCLQLLLPLLDRSILQKRSMISML